MKMSSTKTMLTAAVLVTLSSSTGFAATPGTVDSQELFHARGLVTDPAQRPALEENAGLDRYEASISSQKRDSACTSEYASSPVQEARPTRLRWESVDARIAARNQDTSFTLAAQKAKPVIITAEDIKREERLAEKEGRPVQELVGDVNMNREGTSSKSETDAVSERKSDPAHQAAAAIPAHTAADPSYAAQMQEGGAEQQPHAHESAASASSQEPGMEQMDASPSAPEQRPARQRYQQLPHETFSLTPPAENGIAPKRPDSFDKVGDESAAPPAVPAVKDQTPVVEHSVRPDGVPEMDVRPQQRSTEADMADISDEVRRHILAGQLAMEVQLQRDPSVAGMRAITKVLRENTTLTRLQKIDFLIGFGRALHQSGLPRQQEALLIKTIAESF